MNRRRWLQSVKKLRRQVNSGKKVVIYPYGKMGKLLETFVTKRLRIDVAFVMDNFISRTNKAVYPLSFLNSLDTSEFVFLFASTNSSLRKELLNDLCKYVKKTQLIDFYGQNRFLNSLYKFSRRWYMLGFLHSIKNERSTRVLDVGCGNASAAYIKKVCDKVFYTGIDVGDYNQTDASLSAMDKYYVVSPEEFATKIAEMDTTEDYVISSHNLEHCNDPMAVLDAMCGSLKSGGKMYLAFPSEESSLFPPLGGTLNFYDDPTHRNLLDFDEVIRKLKMNGMRILFKRKAYRPFFLRIIGRINENAARSINHTMDGTWAYWGFESIIWAERK